MNKLRSLVASTAAVLILAGCVTASMMHLRPIAVPASLSRAQVGHAIRQALVGRGWVITGAGKNSYTAVLTGHGWKATIRTPYNTQHVEVQYVSSRGLDHRKENGGETINHHWNNWMVALRHDIRANLSNEAYGSQYDKKDQ